MQLSPVNHVTAAGSEEIPSSGDTRRNLNLQKRVKHTLSTWGTHRTYPEGHNSPDTFGGERKLYVDWASIAQSCDSLALAFSQVNNA